MDYGSIIQAALSLAGEMQARGEKDKAMALLQGGLDEFGRIDLPKLEKMVAQELGPSQVSALKADPTLVGAQNQALGSLDEVISGNGLAAADRADINSVGNQVARQARGSRDALQASMGAHGALGSGADYAAQAKIAQDQAANMSEAGANTQSQTLKRRFDAMLAKGNLAGQMRGQDFGERHTSAEAADEIARYNAGARDAANRYNLGLPQQNYENALRKQAGKTGQLNAVAGAHNQNADDDRLFWAGLGRAANRAVS